MSSPSACQVTCNLATWARKRGPATDLPRRHQASGYLGPLDSDIASKEQVNNSNIQWTLDQLVSSASNATTSIWPIMH